ncbi:hypothetical protein [Chryseobacterium gambrini]|uniref:hypothetical protein n=1 Tax=Chryseobacterium gambrini TaxID=373672 RepID=UPI003D09E925
MKSKRQLWEIIKVEFENDILLNEEDQHFICDVILQSEPELITEEEMYGLLDEMKEYADEKGLRSGGPFWEIDDLESRFDFINEKIKYHEIEKIK